MLLWQRSRVRNNVIKNNPVLIFVFSFAKSSRRNKASSSNKEWKSPYHILGVNKNADDKELKLAYFKAAKLVHPDLNPHDLLAAKKFQDVADAYELLKDETRRRIFDSSSEKEQKQQTQSSSSSSSSSSSNESGSQQYQYHQQQQASASASDTFKEVAADAEVIAQAFNMYTEELQEEFRLAATHAYEGKWKEAMYIVNENKGLILTVGSVKYCFFIFFLVSLIIYNKHLILLPSKRIKYCFFLFFF